MLLLEIHGKTEKMFYYKIVLIIAAYRSNFPAFALQILKNLFIRKYQICVRIFIVGHALTYRNWLNGIKCHSISFSPIFIYPRRHFSPLIKQSGETKQTKEDRHRSKSFDSSTNCQFQIPNYCQFKIKVRSDKFNLLSS